MKSDRHRTRFVWSLLFAWAVLALVTVVWALPHQQDDLTGEAELALQEAGIAAVVKFDGRDANLSGGTPASEQALAIELVGSITGVREARWTEPILGHGTATTTPTTTTTTTGAQPQTTTSAPPATTIAPTVASSLTATLSRGALTLSGTIPNSEIALRVGGVADLVYGPFVTNNLVVDESVAESPWVPNAPSLMAFLPIVGEAELQVFGNEATLTGTAGSAEKKGQLEAALGAALGGDVSVTSTIEVTNTAPPLYIADAPGDGTVTLSGVMPDQSAIDLIADAAIEAYGEDNVVNDMTIGTDIDTTFSIFRIPLTFAQFKPIPEWELRIENDVISGNVRGGATFDFGSAELTPELRVLLETGAGILLRNPSILMTIEGHTDSIGSDAFNLALSNARAEAGVDYLVALGVQPERLLAVGYGETRPIADNGTASGRTQNRRLEFVLGPPS